MSKGLLVKHYSIDTKLKTKILDLNKYMLFI